MHRRPRDKQTRYGLLLALLLGSKWVSVQKTMKKKTRLSDPERNCTKDYLVLKQFVHRFYTWQLLDRREVGSSNPSRGDC